MKNKTGKLIKKHREKKHMTQLELAEKLGFYSPQAVSNIERGERKIPVFMIHKISKHVDLSMEKIVKAMALDYENSIRFECEGLG